jgi:hypothetical protein
MISISIPSVGTIVFTGYLNRIVDKKSITNVDNIRNDNFVIQSLFVYHVVWIKYIDFNIKFRLTNP